MNVRKGGSEQHTAQREDMHTQQHASAGGALHVTSWTRGVDSVATAKRVGVPARRVSAGGAQSGWTESRGAASPAVRRA